MILPPCNCVSLLKIVEFITLPFFISSLIDLKSSLVSEELSWVLSLTARVVNGARPKIVAVTSKN
jgi:hypothetical protein